MINRICTRLDNLYIGLFWLFFFIVTHRYEYLTCSFCFIFCIYFFCFSCGHSLFLWKWVQLASLKQPSFMSFQASLNDVIALIIYSGIWRHFWKMNKLLCLHFLRKLWKPLKETKRETIRNNRASLNIALIASGHDSLQRFWNSLWILLPEFITVKVMWSNTVEVNVLGVIWQKCTL